MKKSCFYSILSSSHIKGFEVFCKSLNQSNPWIQKIGIPFLITSLDLSEEEKKHCKKFYKNILWMEKVKHNLNLNDAKIGESAFYKLSAFSIYNYDLVISIDCSDMIIVKPIGELFSYEKEIAMVQGWTPVAKWQQYNGGLVVLNKRFRNPNTYKKLLSFPVTRLYDQDILNNFFKQMIFPLPYTFNFSKRMIENKELNLKDAKIIHYVGEKPWQEYKDKNKYLEIEKIWHEKSRL